MDSSGNFEIHTINLILSPPSQGPRQHLAISFGVDTEHGQPAGCVERSDTHHVVASPCWHARMTDYRRKFSRVSLLRRTAAGRRRRGGRASGDISKGRWWPFS